MNPCLVNILPKYAVMFPKCWHSGADTLFILILYLCVAKVEHPWLVVISMSSCFHMRPLERSLSSAWNVDYLIPKRQSHHWESLRWMEYGQPHTPQCLTLWTEGRLPYTPQTVSPAKWNVKKPMPNSLLVLKYGLPYILYKNVISEQNVDYSIPWRVSHHWTKCVPSNAPSHFCQRKECWLRHTPQTVSPVNRMYTTKCPTECPKR